jgi:hypothetical protein
LSLALGVTMVGRSLLPNCTLQGRDIGKLLTAIQAINATELKVTAAANQEILASYKERHLLQSYSIPELGTQFSKLTGYEISVRMQIYDSI